MNDKELKARRERLQMNRTEMAEALKTPLTTYCNWERAAARVPGIVEVAIEGIEFMQGGKKK